MAQRNKYSAMAEAGARPAPSTTQNSRNPPLPEERQREIARKNALARWEGEGGHLPEPDESRQN